MNENEAKSTFADSLIWTRRALIGGIGLAIKSRHDADVTKLARILEDFVRLVIRDEANPRLTDFASYSGEGVCDAPLLLSVDRDRGLPDAWSAEADTTATSPPPRRRS